MDNDNDSAPQVKPVSTGQRLLAVLVPLLVIVIAATIGFLLISVVWGIQAFHSDSKYGPAPTSSVLAPN
jgi:hypothetical protein